MADQEEEDLKMALSMSRQNMPPELKRSKQRDAAARVPMVSPEDYRRLQCELMAAVTEKWIKDARNVSFASNSPVSSSVIAKSSESESKERLLEVKNTPSPSNSSDSSPYIKKAAILRVKKRI